VHSDLSFSYTWHRVVLSFMGSSYPPSASGDYGLFTVDGGRAYVPRGSRGATRQAGGPRECVAPGNTAYVPIASRVADRPAGSERFMASLCNPISFAGPERTTVWAMFPGSSPIPHQAAHGTCQCVVDGNAPIVRNRIGDDDPGPVRLELCLAVLLQ
jgi:hypothetical protein